MWSNADDDDDDDVGDGSNDDDDDYNDVGGGSNDNDSDEYIDDIKHRTKFSFNLSNLFFYLFFIIIIIKTNQNLEKLFFISKQF